jgi:hypothetical protein
VNCDRSVVFSAGSPVSSINTTDRHDITEILLKVTLQAVKHICKMQHLEMGINVHLYQIFIIYLYVHLDVT